MLPAEQPNYRAEIDGLRAFAVLSVVLFHAFPSWLVGGFIGVDVFFVISGFLITSHIFEKLDQGEFSFSDFFQRRIRRIFPALITVMVVSLVFGWFILLADEYNQLGKHVAGGAAFISNFIYAEEAGYFDSAAELKPMLHLWSLAVEEQFYILWPLALWVAWKLNINLFAFTLIVLLASFFTNINWVDENPTETFFWPFGRFWELLSGSLLAWFLVSKQKYLVRQNVLSIENENSILQRLSSFLQGTRIRGLSSFIGLLLLVLGVQFISEELPFPSYWALIPIIGALLIIYGGAQTNFSRLLLTNRIAVWFGLISYPLYLWHWPVLSFLHIIDDGAPHRDGRIIAVALSILLAWLTYKFIEKPIRFGKIREPIRALSLATAMVLVGSIGLLISLLDYSESKTTDTVLFRKGLEHKIGSSGRWYEGKENWLFLGNDHDRTVEKLKLAIKPEHSQIDELHTALLRLSDTAAFNDIKVAMLVGPNKSTIYPEYLPTNVEPSKKRYFDFYSEALIDIPNFVLHDPTEHLLRRKNLDGLLYFRTDSHWNIKGAFLAYEGLSRRIGSPIPKVEFSPGPLVNGELIGMSELKDFPVSAGDNWKFTIDQNYELERQKIENSAESEAFGQQEIVTNSNPLSDMVVWVIGDSFANAQKPFIEATFREVHYVGHWYERLKNLSSELEDARVKPDLILIVRVERSF